MSCNEDVETFQLLHFESLFKKMHQFLAHHSKFKSDTNPANQSVICYKNDSNSKLVCYYQIYFLGSLGIAQRDMIISKQDICQCRLY